MRWLVALRLGGAVLLVAAAVALSLQVHVGGAGPSRRWCGSSLDVITDRAGWEVWFAEDTVDATTSPDASLVRTLRCPAAVNARTVLAGVLGAAGLVALIVAASLRRAGRTAPPPREGAASGRLRRLGTTVTVLGATLAGAGLLAIGVLLADRDAPLFTFVPRSVVAAIGLVVLTPVGALLVAGRALALVARALDDPDHEPDHGQDHGDAAA
jgi:multisubunit Na+/H+ antiporter MnhG subunit